MSSIGSADDDVDPRKLRSRSRLLDAATTLLNSGGVEAVTIEAVTRLSKVARTTLYRHFDSALQLRAATFERLLPPGVEPAPAGPIRERLLDMVCRQAEIINEAPMQLSTMAWLATGENHDAGDGTALTSLRQRLIEQYQRPFDQFFDAPEVRAELGEFDVTRILAQLIGPIVFVRLLGIDPVTPAECARIVDDFLAARAADRAIRDRPDGRAS